MYKLAQKQGFQFFTRPKSSPIATIHDWKTCNMHVRDSYGYTNLLHQSHSVKMLKEIHAQIVIGGYEQNLFVATKLVGKYAEFANSNVVDACKVFDKMPERDVSLWNIIIKGYSRYGLFEKALSYFDQMQAARVAGNRYTFPFVLKACGGLKETSKGKMIHGYIVKRGFDSDLFIGNALVTFYGKCQIVDLSRAVFDGIPHKDIISWNSIISVYVFNGLSSEALDLFHVMLNDRSILPDHATLVSILPACAQESAIKEGMWIHWYMIKYGIELNAALGSGLVSVYANSGCLNTARLIFDQISTKNIVVWNTMIRAYGTHGQADKALELYSEFVQTGLQPDGILFLCLLSACSHAGLVSEGCKLFDMMEECGIEKNHEHYACMIDLYSRAGFIKEAIEFIKTMPIQAGKDAYGALLGACRIHNNIDLAEEVAKKLFELDPGNPGRYLILIKMYEDAGRYEDAAKLRTMLRKKDIRRSSGYSDIELDHIIHRFGAEAESHHMGEQIMDTLHKLKMVMEDEEIIVNH